MRGFTGRNCAKNSYHGLPFSRFKSGRVTSSDSERAPGPNAVQFEVVPPPMKGRSVCPLPHRDYAPGNSPGPRGSGPDWPPQKRSTGETRQTHRQGLVPVHGDVIRPGTAEKRGR